VCVCVCVCVYTNLGGLHLVACAAAPACEVGQDFTLLTIHTRLHLTPPLLSNYRCYTHTHTHHMEHGERPLMLVHNSKDTVTSSEYRGHIMEWGRKKKSGKRLCCSWLGVAPIPLHHFDETQHYKCIGPEPTQCGLFCEFVPM